MSSPLRWLRAAVVVLYRSARTGKFVSRKYAEANPDTTVKETRKKTP